MGSTKRVPRHSKEEFARRGEAIFEKDIRAAVKSRDPQDFVLIDIETGAFEVDADEDAASDRLIARVPDAQIWMRRVGSRAARRFGGRGKWIDQCSPGRSTPAWTRSSA